MAEVTNIELEGGDPVSVTMRFTVEELATVTKLLGRVASPNAEICEVYDALTGEFFNRYWDAGVADVETALKIPGDFKIRMDT